MIKTFRAGCSQKYYNYLTIYITVTFVNILKGKFTVLVGEKYCLHITEIDFK